MLKWFKSLFFFKGSLFLKSYSPMNVWEVLVQNRGLWLHISVQQKTKLNHQLSLSLPLLNSYDTHFEKTGRFSFYVVCILLIYHPQNALDKCHASHTKG